jgi:hypothetical protein
MQFYSIYLEKSKKKIRYYISINYTPIFIVWDLRAAQNLSLEFVGIGNKHKETLTENGM